MTEEEAKQRVNILRQKSDFTIDETVEGFQLALSLGDRLQALSFQKTYENMLYDSFFDAALNITKQGSVDFFLKHFNSWKRMSFGDIRYIHLGLILKQKEHTHNFELLNDTIFQVTFSASGIEQLGWPEKSFDELKSLYDNEVKKSKEESTQDALSRYALKSNDIILIQKIFDELPPKHWLIDDITEHMVKVLAESNFDDAIQKLNTIKSDFHKKRIRYDLAKKVYRDNPECSKALLSQTAQEDHYGFDAYLAVQNDDEREILSLIHFLDSELEFEHIDEGEYDESLFSIGFEILDKYPLIALELIEKVHVKWADLFDLQYSVISSLMTNGYTEIALEFYNDMNDDLCQMMALMEVAEKSDNRETLEFVLSRADQLEIDRSTYFVYEQVFKKMPIEFQRMYSVVSKILPLEMTFDEPEELAEMCERYFSLQ